MNLSGPIHRLTRFLRLPLLGLYILLPLFHLWDLTHRLPLLNPSVRMHRFLLLRRLNP